MARLSSTNLIDQDTRPAGYTRATTTHQSVSYLQTDLRKGLGANGGGCYAPCNLASGSIALVRAGQYPILGKEDCVARCLAGLSALTGGGTRIWSESRSNEHQGLSMTKARARPTNLERKA
jgi:hypothetical protein